MDSQFKNALKRTAFCTKKTKKLRNYEYDGYFVSFVDVVIGVVIFVFIFNLNLTERFQFTLNSINRSNCVANRWNKRINKFEKKTTKFRIVFLVKLIIK